LLYEQRIENANFLCQEGFQNASMGQTTKNFHSCPRYEIPVKLYSPMFACVCRSSIVCTWVTKVI